MYELRSQIAAQSSLREVRDRSLPSLRRGQVQAGEMHLLRAAQPSAARHGATAESGRPLTARVVAIFTRRTGPTAAALGRSGNG
jgi:hypothetical protein